eukprot:Mycagemm_TRINITY_DN9714_c0_g1::TRINITY_DN9714_c0_g1_i1::g.4819::m.4819 type:complete len:121 gc:universal TRINITY_DN9714_c0_g1_i1:381-19(-)
MAHRCTPREMHVASLTPCRLRCFVMVTISQTKKTQDVIEVALSQRVIAGTLWLSRFSRHRDVNLLEYGPTPVLGPASAVIKHIVTTMKDCGIPFLDAPQRDMRLPGGNCLWQRLFNCDCD